MIKLLTKSVKLKAEIDDYVLIFYYALLYYMTPNWVINMDRD